MLLIREERIRALTYLAPWKLCGNQRHMVLPPEVSAQLGWGLLAAGSWYSRRPTRWLKVTHSRRHHNILLEQGQTACKQTAAVTTALARYVYVRHPYTRGSSAPD